MDVLPAEMPQPMLAGFTAAETMVVPTIITSESSTSASGGGAASGGGSASSNQDNIALPPSTRSLVNPSHMPSALISTTVTADTIVTHCSSKSSPQITVVVPTATTSSASAGPVMTNITSESMIQIHSNTTSSDQSMSAPGGQRVALVTSQNNPNKISIVPSEQIFSNVVIGGGGGGCVTSNCVVAQQQVANTSASAAAAVHENPISDENSINQANRIQQQQQPPIISAGSSSKPVHNNQTKCKTSASCGTLKEECQSPNVKKRRKSANISASAKSAASLIHESDSTTSAAAGGISNSDQSLPEKEEYKIQLKKDTNGLGITIAGYVCEKGMYVHCTPWMLGLIY